VGEIESLPLFLFLCAGEHLGKGLGEQIRVSHQQGGGLASEKEILARTYPLIALTQECVLLAQHLHEKIERIARIVDR